MTGATVDRLKAEVQRLLDERVRADHRSYRLEVSGTVEDADWLYVIVQPDRVGVHSEDYIEVARWVEAQLSKSHPAQQVLLVPGKPQD